jgi:hypothetical protein
MSRDRGGGGPVLFAAPCLGDYTELVLKQFLGMSEDEIVRYAEGGTFV